MNIFIKGITITLLIIALTSCNVSNGKPAETSSLTTSLPTIHITIKPTTTPSPPPTGTPIPVTQETSVSCPSTPTSVILENGLLWKECVIPDREYYYVKHDVELLTNCINFPNGDDHDETILGERIQGSNGSDLRLIIGDDTYETKYDNSRGCCEYDLLKNGVVIFHTSAPLITTDPNRTFWNIEGKLVWELLALPPVIIVDGVDFNEKYHLEGSYYPYEINGKLIFIAKKYGKYQIIYDDKFIGPEFENISKSYCCAGISVMRGGNQYWFLGKREGVQYIVSIQ